MVQQFPQNQHKQLLVQLFSPISLQLFMLVWWPSCETNKLLRLTSILSIINNKSRQYGNISSGAFSNLHKDTISLKANHKQHWQYKFRGLHVGILPESTIFIFKDGCTKIDLGILLLFQDRIIRVCIWITHAVINLPGIKTCSKRYNIITIQIPSLQRCRIR